MFKTRPVIWLVALWTALVFTGVLSYRDLMSHRNAQLKSVHALEINQLDDPAQEDKPQKLCTSDPCVVGITIDGTIMPPEDLQILVFLLQAQTEGAKAIVIHINSPGGSFPTSRRIFRILKNSSIPTYCVVNGLAASGAFYALQGCTERVAVKDAKLLAHHPAFMLKEDSPPLTKSILKELLAEIEKLSMLMISDLAPRMHMTVDALLSRLDQGDWVMTADEALKANAIDKIVPDVKTYIKEVMKRHGATH